MSQPLKLDDAELRYIVFHTSVTYADALLRGKSIQEAEIFRLATLRDKIKSVQRKQANKAKKGLPMPDQRDDLAERIERLAVEWDRAASDHVTLAMGADEHPDEQLVDETEAAVYRRCAARLRVLLSSLRAEPQEGEPALRAKLWAICRVSDEVVEGGSPEDGIGPSTRPGCDECGEDIEMCACISGQLRAILAPSLGTAAAVSAADVQRAILGSPPPSGPSEAVAEAAREVVQRNAEYGHDNGPLEDAIQRLARALVARPKETT